MEVNLTGVFHVAQEAARRMLAGDGGVIINMGSTNGLAGCHCYADYNTTKAGVIELSRSMALELAPTIRVNAVCPGFIMTPMQEAEYTIEMRQAFEKKLPLNTLGRPHDVAALFAFLASEDAAFITGQYFVIDGGELAGGLAGQTWRFDPLCERRTVSAEFLILPKDTPYLRSVQVSRRWERSRRTVFM